MNILIVDVVLTGHHLPYINALIEEYDNRNEFILLLPQKLENNLMKTYVYNRNYDYKKITDYLAWTSYLRKVTLLEKPDVIIILYGDVLYRYFGLGLNFLRKYLTIITFHKIQSSTLRNLSFKIIFNKIKYGVVHTKFLKDKLNKMNINNVKHIEYPQLYTLNLLNRNEAKKSLNIPEGGPTLLALGGTRRDKGLDILLNALKLINYPFQLLIAGEEIDFSESYIQEITKSYQDKVFSLLRYITDQELSLYISATDYIILPYRKTFNGASGPLAEAVWARKCVIASNHGSLGKTVDQNKLGLTFESENIESLKMTIEFLLKHGYEWNTIAERYRTNLDVAFFKHAYRGLYEGDKANKQ